MGRRLRFQVFVIFVLIVLVFSFYWMIGLEKSEDGIGVVNNLVSDMNEYSVKRTTLFYLATLDWGHPSEMALKYFCGNSSSITTEWTHDKLRIGEADGVIYFGPDTNNFTPLHIPSDSVVRVHFNLEPLGSIHSPCFRNPGCYSYFNWSIGSAEGVNDIVVKYFSKEKFQKFYERELAHPFDPVKFMEEKNSHPDKVVSWLCSACLPKNRYNYMARFMKHIQVDSYGHCLNNKEIPSGGDRLDDGALEVKMNLLPKYKFYMALENLNCKGYISEKVFQCLVTGVVPVFMGHESTYKLLPKGSFINGKDYNSTKELADYLKYLNANDKEYLKYFKWRQDINVLKEWGNNFDDITFASVPCYLHNTYMKFYHNKSSYPRKTLKINQEDLICPDMYDSKP